jgi:NADH dehydrogenase [ubiquinone] 1 alpha subcomplex assembly factor 1
VYGDGRQYIANLRCENWLVDERSKDVWQAFLFARKGEWSEVEIPLSRFLLTWQGKVVEEVVEVNSKRITSIGISLAGGDDQPQVGSSKQMWSAGSRGEGGKGCAGPPWERPCGTAPRG